MGFLDGLLGGSRAAGLPSGVTVRRMRTAYKNKLLEHFAAVFPGRETLVWDDAETCIELAVMAPTAAEPYYVAYTIGMSAEPMNLDSMPRGKKYEWLRTAELMLFLPGDWPVQAAGGPDDLAAPERKAAAWPLRLLRLLAAMPRRGNTWLGAGHSIPNGDPPHPYAPNTPFAGAVLFLPSEKNGPKPVPGVNIGGGMRLMLYTVTPVYPAEMEYKLQYGAEALEQKLQALPGGAGFMTDNRRPCLVQPQPEEQEAAL